MEKMVITFTDNGEVQHTLRDSKFKTNFLGNRKIKRMSEIVHCEVTQQFHIRLINTDVIKYYGHDYVLNVPSYTVALFDTYEEAVDAEISFIDDLRLKGVNISS